MIFNQIIGNPPYHISTGGGGKNENALPLYHTFIEKIIEKNPRSFSLITPSRWMAGRKQLKSFCSNFQKDKRIKSVIDYSTSPSVFENTDIEGGVRYFLWSNDWSGECQYSYDNSTPIYRPLLLKGMTSVLRNSFQIPLVKKVLSDEMFDSIVSAQRPFNIGTAFFKEPEQFIYSDKPKEGFGKIYGMQGRSVCKGYVRLKDIKRGAYLIDKFKIFYPKAYGFLSLEPSNIFQGLKNEVCTQSFLIFGGFKTQKESDSCMSYCGTKFFKVLVYLTRMSHNITADNFSLVPLVPFDREWTDQELYRRFNLDKKDIEFIESFWG